MKIESRFSRSLDERPLVETVLVFSHMYVDFQTWRRRVPKWDRTQYRHASNAFDLRGFVGGVIFLPDWDSSHTAEQVEEIQSLAALARLRHKQRGGTPPPTEQTGGTPPQHTTVQVPSAMRTVAPGNPSLDEGITQMAKGFSTGTMLAIDQDVYVVTGPNGEHMKVNTQPTPKATQ
jgi:hypothetical protein